MSTFRQVRVVCDECGAHSVASNENSLQTRLAAIETGWAHVGLGRDYCPDHIPVSKKRPNVGTEPEALW